MYPKTYYEQTHPEQKIGHCFVLMPFAEQFSEVYETIAGAIEGPELNFTCTRADELFGGGYIIEDILRCIGEAEIVIADLTTRNPNVFYELGVTHMVKDLKKVLIITQDMDDVPLDLRHFRCITYEQNRTGLKRLQRMLTTAVSEISETVYRFSVREGEQYEFPNRLFGPDRCFYDFEITEIRVDIEAAKFHMREYRHVLGRPVQKIREGSYGLHSGESLNLSRKPWQVEIEEVSNDTAHFRVVKLS